MSEFPFARSSTPSKNPKDLPAALLWGLGIGLVAFVVSFTSSSTKTVNGAVTECSYTDFFALIAAVACVGCAALGATRYVRSPGSRPVPRWMVGAVAIGLVVLAGVHVLRGLGTLGGPC